MKRQRLLRFHTDFQKYENAKTEKSNILLTHKTSKQESQSVVKKSVLDLRSINQNEIFNKSFYVKGSNRMQIQKKSQMKHNMSISEHFVKKKVEAEQIMDEQFINFLDEAKKNNGFRGAVKLHSRSQLLYLTPQKRFHSSEKQLLDIKQGLYKLIRQAGEIDVSSSCARQNKIPDNNAHRSFIEYLTEYDPQERANKKQEQGIRNRHRLRHKNLIREKLRNINGGSEYRQKLKNHKIIFESQYKK